MGLGLRGRNNGSQVGKRDGNGEAAMRRLLCLGGLKGGGLVVLLFLFLVPAGVIELEGREAGWWAGLRVGLGIISGVRFGVI